MRRGGGRLTGLEGSVALAEGSWDGETPLLGDAGGERLAEAPTRVVAVDDNEVAMM